MQLDPQQQAAVETESRRALVIAGAGSGKTRVLTERIAHLIENKKVSPFEIMAFSFTRKAAGEIRTRLETRIGSKAHRCYLGTMHGISLQMVRKFGETIGLRPSNVTIYSEWEESFLLKEVAAELGVFKKSWKVPKKEIDAMFAAYYERGELPRENDPGKALFAAFINRCRENNSTTYGELLHAMWRLIPIMAKHLHIRHIMVDECQDIDPMQWSIINHLCDMTGASLFAVGDADQSIYAFRGAVPEYLIEQQHEFDIYRLETNYRSVAEIVEASNRLIAHNRGRIEKTMVPVRKAPVLAPPCPQVHREADSEKLVEIIRAWLLPEESMAVLSRNHALLLKLSSLLTEAGIQHNYVGRKTKLTGSEEFRRFHAFLKLIVNPYDNFSFMLIRELIGLTPTDYAEIRLRAAQDGASHFEEWYKHGIPEGNFFLKVNQESPFVGALWELDEFLKDEKFVPARDFAFNADERSLGAEPALADYLAWLAVWDIQDEVEEETDTLHLMTVHAAKGLEFPTVIIAGCNDGIMPSKQAIAAGEIEEERRLFYVAMTRARNQLILTIRPTITEGENGKVYENPVSRFVGEA